MRKSDALRLKPHDLIRFGNAQRGPTRTGFGIVSRITERGGILVWPIAHEDSVIDFTKRQMWVPHHFVIEKLNAK
jgi:hypothetical protein